MKVDATTRACTIESVHRTITTKSVYFQHIMSKGKVLTTRAKPKSKPTATITSTFTKPTSFQPIAVPPLRVHAPEYHYPLALDDESSSKELLKWFEGIEEARNMPWRKKWLDPAEFDGGDEEFGSLLEKRAYEVWVSEVSKCRPIAAALLRCTQSRWETDIHAVTRRHVHGRCQSHSAHRMLTVTSAATDSRLNCDSIL